MRLSPNACISPRTLSSRMSAVHSARSASRHVRTCLGCRAVSTPPLKITPRVMVAHWRTADSRSAELSYERRSPMSIELVDSVAGITVPDTPLTRDITAFIRDAEDDLLFNHSRRVFFFGALHAQRNNLHPDLELLYAGAMFHDLGLTERYRTSSSRFEVDGANAARQFLLHHGVDKADADKVWLSIALHTTPGIPEFLAPEIALVTAG